MIIIIIINNNNNTVIIMMIIMIIMTLKPLGVDIGITLICLGNSIRSSPLLWSGSETDTKSLAFFCSWDTRPGKRSKNYGKPPFLMGKSTISMAMFNGYVTKDQSVIMGSMKKTPKIGNGGHSTLLQFSPPSSSLRRKHLESNTRKISTTICCTSICLPLWSLFHQNTKNI